MLLCQLNIANCHRISVRVFLTSSDLVIKLRKEAKKFGRTGIMVLIRFIFQVVHKQKDGNRGLHDGNDNSQRDARASRRGRQMRGAQ